VDEVLGTHRYTIARIAPERGGADLVTAVGPLLGAQIGEFLRLRGRWSSHPRYGRQFEVASYAQWPCFKV
jgi:exodeoxyribonuclease V alpha subunit